MGIVVSLCDLTGKFARPWAEAGYECFCVDIEHSIRRDREERVGAGVIKFVWGDVRNWSPPAGRSVAFGACWSPCTHVSGSGARDFAKKGGLMLRDALEMFEAGRQVLRWSGAPSFNENPVGVLSSIPHIGKPDYYFDPSDYAGLCEDDNYTKKTCIWGHNGFVMPEPVPAPWLGEPDDRIHKATPSPDRADFRSATPMGFARAVFAANRPETLSDVFTLGVDNGLLRAAIQFIDRDGPTEMGQALSDWHDAINLARTADCLTTFNPGGPANG